MGGFRDCDVVIIGAGLGGLALGSALSRSGMKVIVVEKNGVAGGYLGGFMRQGYDFEISIHAIDGCAPGGATYRLMRECGIADTVAFFKPKHIYRSIYPGADVRLPQCDLGAHAEMLAELFPRERSNIGKFAAAARQIYESMCGLYLENDMKRALRLIMYTDSTAQDLLDRYIGDDRLKAVLAQYWLYLGLPPSRLSAYYFAYVWYDYAVNGSYYPRGGSKAIVSALVKNIVDAGGEVRLSTEAARIRFDDGRRAVGITLSGGETVDARAVVSNADADATFRILIGFDRLPARFVQKIGKIAFSASAVQVYLGLDCDPQSLGMYDYEILMNPGYNIDGQFGAAMSGAYDDAAICAAFYSNLGTGAGTERPAASIFTFSDYGQWAGIGSRQDYRAMKARVADALIRRCEAVVPGLSRHIAVKEVATPLTMERYTGATRGAVYGLDQTPAQSGMRRLPQEFPFLRDFYLVGASSRPGHGITGALYSARNVYRKLVDSEEVVRA